MLKDLGRFSSIAKELLTWVAVSRWLARNNVFVLAGFALREYVALSMRLSDGASPDVLNRVGDLLKKEWFNRPESKV